MRSLTVDLLRSPPARYRESCRTPRNRMSYRSTNPAKLGPILPELHDREEDVALRDPATHKFGSGKRRGGILISDRLLVRPRVFRSRQKKRAAKNDVAKRRRRLAV